MPNNTAIALTTLKSNLVAVLSKYYKHSPVKSVKYYHDNEPTYYADVSYRNIYLTYDKRLKIEKTIKSINEVNIDSAPDINTVLNNWITSLNALILDNMNLETGYRGRDKSSAPREHVSYRQNRLKNQGFFKAWWNKTFFQSRVNTLAETCLDLIDDYKKDNNIASEKETSDVSSTSASAPSSSPGINASSINADGEQTPGSTSPRATK
ncbi:MAG: hypothetical protein KIT27_04685 [Legionellales bacterium]|nr:hypothetical protein [Legionellales bacterium]